MDTFIHLAFQWAFMASAMACGVFVGMLLARVFTKRLGSTGR